MKVIALLGLVFGGFYFYSNATAPIEIHSYQDLLYKVEREPVTTNEMKLGANMLALVFCNDTSLQESGEKRKRMFKGLRQYERHVRNPDFQ